jgi:hypothetical protein
MNCPCKGFSNSTLIDSDDHPKAVALFGSIKPARLQYYNMSRRTRENVMLSRAVRASFSRASQMRIRRKTVDLRYRLDLILKLIARRHGAVLVNPWADLNFGRRN